MKQSKDPFEAALEEQEESPPDSPVAVDELESQTHAGNDKVSGLVEDGISASVTNPSTSRTSIARVGKNKYEDEEENVDVELTKFPSSADPTKMAKMQQRRCHLA